MLPGAMRRVRSTKCRSSRTFPGQSFSTSERTASGANCLVVSSGFRELIEPVLEREGLAGLELLANTVDPDPAGWRVSFRDESICDSCGEACKRTTVAALADGREVVYVGDGFSDRCAAEDAQLVFARRGLAAYLSERGVPFEPFDDFFQIAHTIVTAPS